MSISERTGLSICEDPFDTSSAIKTVDQLGGQGVVHNKALAIPGHLKSLGCPVESLEYVTLGAALPGSPSPQVGEHRQSTDEIYFIASGTRAQLTTNGRVEEVEPGDLVVAPRGTMHSIANCSEQPLGFLVIEVQAPGQGHQPTLLRALDQSLEEVDFPHASKPVRMTTIDLAPYFSGAWGKLFLLELPPGGRVESFCQEHDDQNVLIPSGNATILLKENIRLDSHDFGLNIFLPRKVSCGIINRSSRDTLRILLVTLHRAE